MESSGGAPNLAKQASCEAEHRLTGLRIMGHSIGLSLEMLPALISKYIYSHEVPSWIELARPALSLMPNRWLLTAVSCAIHDGAE